VIPRNECSDGIKSVDLAFRIVDELREHDGVRQQELAETFDVSKSTIHRHLTTLEQHGYVVEETGEYHVGLRFLDHGIYARNRRGIFDIVRAKTQQLAEETGERAQFMVAENGLGILLYNHVGSNGVLAAVRPGKYVYLHVAAAGKSILAHLPRSHVEGIIDQHGLPQQTTNTITDRDHLYEELAEIREQGFAFNRGERAENLLSIGVPVIVDSVVIGGLSVTGPDRRMSNKNVEEELANPLLGHAEELELRITYE
jgi:IclR family acetate operon transcriptional repressor